MIVTVGNTKGGVGKTTIAVNLAIARALAGRDVWLIDGDRQGTAQTSISLRAEAVTHQALLARPIRTGRPCGHKCSSRAVSSTTSSSTQVVATRLHFGPHSC
ncbi:ParA family protein [Propionivibrio sp.]|uniref:ParA family protein n=1 Tax=Propionivibrio sp. TaxID=2212460 RepID=UPI0025F42542|nr:ParA family protein [Propionivibrio sp.]